METAAEPEPASEDRARRRLARLGRLLDANFRLPGTSFRFGLDGVIGLIPGVGDLITAGVSAYIIFEARRLGATNAMTIRMIVNVLIDFFIGSVPIVGDIFDFAWKANQKNLKMIGIDVGQAGQR